MDVLVDLIKDWGGGLGGLIAVIISIKVALNDMKHLERDFNKFVDKYNEDKKLFWDKIDGVKDDLEEIKNKTIEVQTRCDERHKND